MNIITINLADESYPLLLADIATPPKSIYVLGSLNSQPLIAIVGSRRPSSYGREITYKLAYECASQGIGVVSGLAIGLDAVAHQAALDAGGYSIAVLPSGLDKVYPSSHRGLALRILRSGGAIISEYRPKTPAYKANFVARNRIVAGLAAATLVTEAQAASGTLITANFAINNNRAVMAVPGNITSRLSAGANNLLRSGAIPITSSADILNYYQIQPSVIKQTKLGANKTEQLIIDLISEGFNELDTLATGAKLSASEIASTLSLMEITGKVINLGAGVWTLS